MLMLILLWIYIFFITFIYGFAVWCLLSTWLGIEPSPAPHLLMILGLLTGTAYAVIYNYFSKVSGMANVILILGALMLAWLFRQELRQYLRMFWKRARQTSWVWWLAGSAVFALVLIRSTFYVHNFDTGLYHAQAIRWIEEYAIVPGLGNLHGRFGTNSSWFLTAALFGSHFLAFIFYNLATITGSPFFRELNTLVVSTPFHSLNAVLIGLVAWDSLLALRRLLKGEYRLSIFIRALFLSFMFIFQFQDLNSPAPDVPAALFVCLAVAQYARWLEVKGDRTRLHSSAVWVMLFSIFAVTVKISTAPILILPLYLLLRDWQKKRAVFVGGVGVLFGIPWITRFYFLTGYLIYLIPEIDLFNPDWKMPANHMLTDRAWVTSWARIPKLPRDVVLKLSLREWLPVWWSNLLIREQLVLLGILLFSLIAFGLWVSKKEFNRDKAVLISTCYLGAGYWFFAAPDIRFGLGFLISLFGILLFRSVSDQQWGRWLVMGFAAVMVGQLVWTNGAYLVESRTSSAVQKRYVIPSGYDAVEVEERRIHDTEIPLYIPVADERCRYAPLPCTPYWNESIELRGPNLQDGFKVNP